MAYIRFKLDLAIPEETYNKIPPSVKLEIRDKIRQLKSYAMKINAGADNEEMTVKASYHVCHHDELNVPCESEIDI